MQTILKNLALLFLGTLLGAAVVLGTATHLPAVGTGSRAPSASAQVAVSGPMTAAEEATADIYQRLSPAVVNVTNRRAPVSGGAQGQFPERGVGSGVIVDEQGHILTNDHVVDRADRLDVTLLDGTRVPATLIGRDPGNDLALIRIEIDDRIRPKLAVAPLGDSDQLRPGQVAIAIGNPFGLQSSMTSGIISSLGRTFSTDSGRPIRHMIQTDAAINPGNSGGPLINSAGLVIGINTAIESPVRGFVGVGFAVPINTARRVLPDLMAGQTIDHPWLGISGMTLTEDLARSVGVSATSGIYVAHVLPDSPAERAALRGAVAADGLQREPSDPLPSGGDVITAVDGRALTSIDELTDYVDSKQVGDTVTLSLLRGGQSLEVQVTLGVWPDDN
ncbi:MAG: S1C family serine protease [Sphingomonadaceae bacterium]